MKNQDKQAIIEIVLAFAAILALMGIFAYALRCESKRYERMRTIPVAAAVTEPADPNIPTYTVPPKEPEEKYEAVEVDMAMGEPRAQENDIEVCTEPELSEDDEILLRIAMAEAEGEGTEGKALVMCVVMNRVNYEKFPDNIKDVVFEKNQFSPVREGGRYYTETPDQECYEALDMVKHGWDESQGALYFESGEGDTWHSRNLDFLFQYGGHKFYK